MAIGTVLFGIGFSEAAPGQQKGSPLPVSLETLSTLPVDQRLETVRNAVNSTASREALGGGSSPTGDIVTSVRWLPNNYLRVSTSYERNGTIQVGTTRNGVRQQKLYALPGNGYFQLEGGSIQDVVHIDVGYDNSLGPWVSMDWLPETCPRAPELHLQIVKSSTYYSTVMFLDNVTLSMPLEALSIYTWEDSGGNMNTNAFWQTVQKDTKQSVYANEGAMFVGTDRTLSLSSACVMTTWSDMLRMIGARPPTPTPWPTSSPTPSGGRG